MRVCIIENEQNISRMVPRDISFHVNDIQHNLLHNTNILKATFIWEFIDDLDI